MLNKQKEKRAWLWMTLCVLVIAAGIALIVNSFVAARREMVSEHRMHLLDIAWSADQNINNLLYRSQEELDYALYRSEEDVRAYEAGGDAAAIERHLEHIPLIEGGYASHILVMDGTKTLCSLPEAGTPEYDFPESAKNDPACVCSDGAGTLYIAITSPMPDSDVFFAALIDLDQFYSLVLSEELSSSYWLGLYNLESQMVMQNDRRHSRAAQIEPEQMLAQKSGLSYLARSELDGEIVTQGYMLEDESLGITEERQIAVIPTNRNKNGVFTVAVSVESAHYFDLVRSLVWRVVAYSLLILLAVIAMLTILRRNRRRSDAAREQVELLQAQNEATQALLEKTQKLAHHQRLELIGTMTSSIAHEFNNLLTPIMGYSLMAMESLSEENSELFDNVAEIYEASFRAKTLVSRLSALSRKNSVVSSRYLSPDTLVEKIRDVAAPSVPRMVKVITELSCPEPCIYGDETQLAQLILNIVINAFQAMEEKGGTLTITTAREDDRVLLQFRDTGPGMSAEVVEHIFEPFYTTKDVSRGTGLGLAIVKQTVESHKGDIQVESELGKGTTFRIRLPLVRDERNEQQ